MEDTILIVAPPEDAHARALGIVLERDFNAVATIWDSAGFPSTDTISLTLVDGGVKCHAGLLDGRAIPMASLRSIWWRRPGKYRIDQAVTDPDIRHFCSQESDASFKGTVEALGVPIVNAPAAEASARRKPLQLVKAAKAGLTIPRTLMSNDPGEVRHFWESVNHRCIYKSFTPPAERLAETRIFAAEDFVDVDKLKHAPLIVQELIDKGRDIRVNIFGSHLFAAEVTTYREEAELDWRLDLTATWSTHTLPENVTGQLHELVRSLGLYYGCIDLRQRPDGQYVFLEINPSGQFLFVEVDTGQPLVHAMAELLLKPAIPFPQTTRTSLATQSPLDTNARTPSNARQV
jgi:hypothetical protein